MFQSKREISRWAKLREISVETFRDFSFHPEEYPFLEILEPCNTIIGHGSHRGLIGIEDENIETTFPFQNFSAENCASASKVSPWTDGIQSFACEAMVSETTKKQDGNHCEELFKAWMDAMKRMTKKTLRSR